MVFIQTLRCSFFFYMLFLSLFPSLSLPLSSSGLISSFFLSFFPLRTRGTRTSWRERRKGSWRRAQRCRWTRSSCTRQWRRRRSRRGKTVSTWGKEKQSLRIRTCADRQSQMATTTVVEAHTLDKPRTGQSPTNSFPNRFIFYHPRRPKTAFSVQVYVHRPLNEVGHFEVTQFTRELAQVQAVPQVA